MIKIICAHHWLLTSSSFYITSRGWKISKNLGLFSGLTTRMLLRGTGTSTEVEPIKKAELVLFYLFSLKIKTQGH
jgi:hypothetical protein